MFNKTVLLAKFQYKMIKDKKIENADILKYSNWLSDELDRVVESIPDQKVDSPENSKLSQGFNVSCFKIKMWKKDFLN